MPASEMTSETSAAAAAAATASNSQDEQHAYDLLIDGVRTLIQISSIIVAILLGFMTGFDMETLDYSWLGKTAVFCLSLSVFSCLLVYLRGVLLAQSGQMKVSDGFTRWVFTAGLAGMFFGMLCTVIFGFLNI